MGIDGIHKPASPPHLGELSSLENPEVRFEPTQTTPSETPSPIASTESSLLQQLEQGRLTREQYLERRVDEAIAPFTNRITPDQLEHVRSTLREQLQSDPTLLELVRRVTENANAG